VKKVAQNSIQITKFRLIMYNVTTGDLKASTCNSKYTTNNASILYYVTPVVIFHTHPKFLGR
jgi:hypothetical protein